MYVYGSSDVDNNSYTFIVGPSKLYHKLNQHAPRPCTQQLVLHESISNTTWQLCMFMINECASAFHNLKCLEILEYNNY